MIIGNLVGFVMFALAAIVFALGSYTLKFPDVVVMSAAGALLILLDLGMRIVQSASAGWLYKSRYGGSLFFVPAWAFGIFVVIVNVLASFAD